MHMQETDTPEVMVAQWQEQVPVTQSLSPQNQLLFLIGGIVLIVLFVLLGYFMKEWTLYFAAPVGALALITMKVQHHREEVPRVITITNQRIIVGEQNYGYTELSGFWLEPTGSTVVITLEYKRPSIVPVTLFFKDTDEQLTRQTLLQVLPELEARKSHFTDQIANKYIHF